MSTPEIEQAWVEAYPKVVALMKQAHQKYPNKLQKASLEGFKLSDKRLKDVLPFLQNGLVHIEGDFQYTANKCQGKTPFEYARDCLGLEDYNKFAGLDNPRFRNMF